MQTTTWEFDLVHSAIQFRVRHLMVSKVLGRFTRWSGRLDFDDASPRGAGVEVRIDAASIDTKETDRDAHLRSPDFLDVANHPEITFRSTAAEAAGEDGYRLRGDLTIRGVTKPVLMEVQYAGRVRDPWGGERVGFSARTSINRKDFGLTWNQVLEAGGVLVGDKVEIDVEVEAVRAAAATAMKAAP